MIIGTNILLLERHTSVACSDIANPKAYEQFLDDIPVTDYKTGTAIGWSGLEYSLTIYETNKLKVECDQDAWDELAKTLEEAIADA